MIIESVLLPERKKGVNILLIARVGPTGVQQGEKVDLMPEVAQPQHILNAYHPMATTLRIFRECSVSNDYSG